MKQVLALLLVLSASAVFGADEVGPFHIVVKAGSFEERCVRLEAGRSIAYAFRADAPVNFNIHFHVGKDVHYPVRESGVREAKGTFTAERTDHFCLMWESAESAVRLEGSVERIR